VSTARIWEIVSNRFWTSVTSVGIEETYSSNCGDRVFRSSQMAFWSVMYFSRSSRNFWSDAGRSDHLVIGVIWDCCLHIRKRAVWGHGTETVELVVAAVEVGTNYLLRQEKYLYSLLRMQNHLPILLRM
jgi:hypothetical protein